VTGPSTLAALSVTGSSTLGAVTATSLTVTGGISDEDRGYNLYTFAKPFNVTENNYWIEIGSFTTEFTGSVTFRLVTTLDLSYCDSITLDIAYTMSTFGQGILSARRSGNTNANLHNGCSFAGITYLSDASAVHKVYVYLGGYCAGQWHTSYVSTGGTGSNFTLNTVPVSSQGLDAFYFDPNMTIISTTGEGTSFREMWSTTSHASLATADLTQTTQLVGQLKSANIPANTTRWVKLCTLFKSFACEIRVTNETPPNRGSCATIRVDFNQSSAQGALATPISITRAGDLPQFAFVGLDTATIGVYMYGVATAYTCKYSVIKYDANPDYKEQTTALITASVPALETLPAGARVIDTTSPTTFVDNVSESGTLSAVGLSVTGGAVFTGTHTHNGTSMSVCYKDAGNYIEMASTNNQTLIDFHSQDGANIDYNNRIISQGNNMVIAGFGNLSLSVAGQINLSTNMYYDSTTQVPVIEHLHVNFAAGGLNTVSGGVQTIKTQTLSGYNFTTKGTSVIITLEGYWNLSGSLTTGGMSIGPCVVNASFGNSPYYPSAVGYGFNGFSCTGVKTPLTKGQAYTLGLTYQALADGTINGSLNVTHAIIYHYA
jgi:hypothetical protein